VYVVIAMAASSSGQVSAEGRDLLVPRIEQYGLNADWKHVEGVFTYLRRKIWLREVQKEREADGHRHRRRLAGVPPATAL